METNEIMLMDEDFEMTEDERVEDSGNGLAVVAGVGLTALAGGVIYKFVVKPFLAKRKAKKEQNDIVEVEAERIDDCDAE